VNAVADYLALEPRRYPWLTRLAIDEAPDVSTGLALELEFRDDAAGRLMVRCEGVRELVFKQPWTTDMRLHGLHVTDVRDRQLGGIGYVIADVEEEFLSFKAASLSASADG
jgi:hypothetical protein